MAGNTLDPDHHPTRERKRKTLKLPSKIRADRVSPPGAEDARSAFDDPDHIASGPAEAEEHDRGLH